MRKILGNFGYLAAIAALLVGASLLAQTPAQPATTQSQGALDYIDASALALHLQIDDHDQTIAYDATTVFMDKGAKIEAAKLQRGDKLKVDWVERDGKKVAVRVEVVERAPGMTGGAIS